MSLWGYRLDAVRARVRARLAGWLGLRCGRGAQIHPGARVRSGAGSALGEASILYRHVQMLATGSGRFTIGARSHIAPGGYLLIAEQQLAIGNDVAIGPGLMLFCESNAPTAHGLFREQYERGDVRIGSNVFIGARVTVLPGSVIEDDVVVAAHALVRGHLASGWVYGGVPARPLHRIDRTERTDLTDRTDRTQHTRSTDRTDGASAPSSHP
ncbi:acyltransferase [Roseateles amylovorans]|uniref:Acyltransferase n=1 Tax=Roseateles amylovorans TaxID=2978473 RepID=A0ABY6AXF1_9BURK|nr:acyltransferase [Roseateles amylovorans]UXH77652.1 acyltransferase [Roseateles amylovorans]